MQELIKESKSEQSNEFSLGELLSKLIGNPTDMDMLLSHLAIA
jgi:hypothetical protein